MFNSWLNHQIKPSTFSFTVIEISEKEKINQEIKAKLQQEIIDSYCKIEDLKVRYQHKDKNKFEEFLKTKLPSMKDQLSKNVWQGDVGEVLAALIVSHFQNREVPIKKMRFKTNKDKSVFGVDMIATNKGEVITDIYQYEIKTKENLCEKDYGKKGNPRYISIVAHESLNQDNVLEQNLPGWLVTFYLASGEMDKVKKYWDVFDKEIIPIKHFELFIIGDASSYNEIILTALDSLSIKLSPLNVTIFLIENFKKLISDLRTTIINEAVNIIYHS